MVIEDFCSRLIQGIRRAKEGADPWVCLECRKAAADDFRDLETSGYHVYRDFPGKRFVIEYVAVGPSGVFAMAAERPERRRLAKRGGKALFDGRLFRSPVLVEEASLAGIRRQAAWLSAWLEERIGEAVTVYPLLVLTGWLQNRSTWGDIVLVSLSDYLTLTTPSSGVLRGSIIDTISRRLAARCPEPQVQP
jgi:hypothetical protein